MTRTSSTAATPLHLARSAIRAVGRIVRAVMHRQDAAILAGVDERMLVDIGLSRSELRDASAEPRWRDPTVLLVKRAGERRVPRCPAVRDHSGEAIGPEPATACVSRARAA